MKTWKFRGDFEGKESLMLKGQMVGDMDSFISIRVAFPQLTKLRQSVVSECIPKEIIWVKN